MFTKANKYRLQLLAITSIPIFSITVVLCIFFISFAYFKYLGFSSSLQFICSVSFIHKHFSLQCFPVFEFWLSLGVWLYVWHPFWSCLSDLTDFGFFCAVMIFVTHLCHFCNFLQSFCYFVNEYMPWMCIQPLWIELMTVLKVRNCI